MSTYQQMLYVSLASSVLSLFGARRCHPPRPVLTQSAALLSQGELVSSMAFSFTYPSFFFQALTYVHCAVNAFSRADPPASLSLCAVFGVMVIYTTVKEFGALIFATIMTTRQLLNILLSCIIYLHPLTLMQWVGVAMVFGTMYVKSSDKKESGKGHGHGAAAAPKPLAEVKVEKEKVRVAVGSLSLTLVQTPE